MSCGFTLNKPGWTYVWTSSQWKVSLCYWCVCIHGYWSQAAGNVSVMLLLFSPSSQHFYICCTWSIYLAWRSRATPLKREAESSFHLWTALFNSPLQSLTSPNHCCLSLCFPPSPSPPSSSIRQIWRSLWSMCSRGTSKRFQGSWIRAWTQTSTIQTQEVWECGGFLSGCHSPRFHAKWFWIFWNEPSVCWPVRDYVSC